MAKKKSTTKIAFKLQTVIIDFNQPLPFPLDEETLISYLRGILQQCYPGAVIEGQGFNKKNRTEYLAKLQSGLENEIKTDPYVLFLIGDNDKQTFDFTFFIVLKLLSQNPHFFRKFYLSLEIDKKSVKPEERATKINALKENISQFFGRVICEEHDENTDKLREKAIFLNALILCLSNQKLYSVMDFIVEAEWNLFGYFNSSTFARYTISSGLFTLYFETTTPYYYESLFNLEESKLQTQKIQLFLDLINNLYFFILKAACNNLANIDVLGEQSFSYKDFLILKNQIKNTNLSEQDREKARDEFNKKLEKMTDLFSNDELILHSIHAYQRLLYHSDAEKQLIVFITQFLEKLKEVDVFLKEQLELTTKLKHHPLFYGDKGIILFESYLTFMNKMFSLDAYAQSIKIKMEKENIVLPEEYGVLLGGRADLTQMVKFISEAGNNDGLMPETQASLIYIQLQATVAEIHKMFQDISIKEILRYMTAEQIAINIEKIKMVFGPSKLRDEESKKLFSLLYLYFIIAGTMSRYLEDKLARFHFRANQQGCYSYQHIDNNINWLLSMLQLIQYFNPSIKKAYQQFLVEDLSQFNFSPELKQIVEGTIKAIQSPEINYQSKNLLEYLPHEGKKSQVSLKKKQGNAKLKVQASSPLGANNSALLQQSFQSKPQAVTITKSGITIVKRPEDLPSYSGKKPQNPLFSQNEEKKNISVENSQSTPSVESEKHPIVKVCSSIPTKTKTEVVVTSESSQPLVIQNELPKTNILDKITPSAPNQIKEPLNDGSKLKPDTRFFGSSKPKIKADPDLLPHLSDSDLSSLSSEDKLRYHYLNSILMTYLKNSASHWISALTTLINLNSGTDFSGFLIEKLAQVNLWSNNLGVQLGNAGKLFFSEAQTLSFSLTEKKPSPQGIGYDHCLEVYPDIRGITWAVKCEQGALPLYHINLVGPDSLANQPCFKKPHESRLLYISPRDWDKMSQDDQEKYKATSFIVAHSIGYDWKQIKALFNQIEALWQSIEINLNPHLKQYIDNVVKMAEVQIAVYASWCNWVKVSSSPVYNQPSYGVPLGQAQDFTKESLYFIPGPVSDLLVVVSNESERSPMSSFGF